MARSSEPVEGVVRVGARSDPDAAAAISGKPVSAPTTARLADISRQVADLANEVVDEARGSGRDDLAQLVEASAARWSDPQVSVVVAGEIGAGKTALVNALVGRHRLLPSGVGLRTGVVTVVEPSTDSEVGAEARLDDRDDPIRIPLDELEDWLGTSGERGAHVAEVRVRVPDPLVGDRTVLVDTPGVAGPDTTADRLVLAVLSRADVLLFVSDAGAPTGRAELDFLAKARNEVGCCLVATTRIDRFRGWATIRESSVEILERELGDWITAEVGVSSLLAEAADEVEATDPAAAEEVRAESGIRGLTDVLGLLAARVKFLRLQGLLLVMARVIDALAAPVASEVDREDASSSELIDQAADLRAEHAALKERAGSVLQGFGDEVATQRDRIGIALRRLASEVSNEHEEHFHSSKAKPDELLDAMESDLRAAQLRFDEVLEQALAELGGWLADEIDPGDADAGTAGASDPDPSWRRAPLATTAKSDFSLRLRMAAILASAGGGTAMLLMVPFQSAGASPLRGGLMGLSMLLGSVASNVGIRQSRDQKRLQPIRTRAKELVEDWQVATLAAGRTRLMQGQRDLERAARASVRERLAELELQASGLEAAARESDLDRRRRTEATREAAARLESLRGRIRGHDDAVRAAIAGLIQPTRGPTAG